jgi:hypothetical protein
MVDMAIRNRTVKMTDRTPPNASLLQKKSASPALKKQGGRFCYHAPGWSAGTVRPSRTVTLDSWTPQGGPPRFSFSLLRTVGDSRLSRLPGHRGGNGHGGPRSRWPLFVGSFLHSATCQGKLPHRYSRQNQANLRLQPFPSQVDSFADVHRMTDCES